MTEDKTSNEADLKMMKAYLDNQEKLKAFITTYMYILSTGMGDGISESELIESNGVITLINENIDINEGVIGNVVKFIKGKTAITKYYKGLDGAAKNYISKAKHIDKLDNDKKSGVRKQALNTYNSTVKSLNDVKKNIDELKKDSTILSKYDAYANNKYKIKLFLSGRKSDVSLSKLKGYSDDIAAIKANQKDLQADIDAANDETKDEEIPKEDETSEETPKEDKPTEVEKKVETGDGGREGRIKANKVKTIDSKRDELKAPKKRLERLEKEGKMTSEQGVELLKLQKELRELSKEKEKLQESVHPLSFFIKLRQLNESIKCLENSIEGNL